MPGYRKDGIVPPIKADGPLNFAHLNLGVLRQLLLTSTGRPDVQREVIAELRKQRPIVRANELIKVLVDMINNPNLFSRDVTEAIVEVLATDPYPEATEAMLERLPEIARAGNGRTAKLTRSTREYFYQALVTRTRDTDQPVWDALVPRLSGETLVDILADPAAKPLIQVLKPLEVIDRLPRRERRQALFATLLAGTLGDGLKALGLLLTGPGR